MQLRGCHSSTCEPCALLLPPGQALPAFCQPQPARLPRYCLCCCLSPALAALVSNQRPLVQEPADVPHQQQQQHVPHQQQQQQQQQQAVTAQPAAGPATAELPHTSVHLPAQDRLQDPLQPAAWQPAVAAQQATPAGPSRAGGLQEAPLTFRAGQPSVQQSAVPAYAVSTAPEQPMLQQQQQQQQQQPALPTFRAGAPGAPGSYATGPVSMSSLSAPMQPPSAAQPVFRAQPGQQQQAKASQLQQHPSERLPQEARPQEVLQALPDAEQASAAPWSPQPSRRGSEEGGHMSAALHGKRVAHR